MKRFLLTFLLCSLFFVNLDAQIPFVIPVGGNNGHSVNTGSTPGRYEFVQSTLVMKQAFVLDKYQGRVWQYKSSDNIFTELQINDKAPLADSVQVNFQLYMSGENSDDCFLMNVHTGEMWVYRKENRKKAFRKLETPWFKEE